MYAALWRSLPGRTWVRAVFCLVLAAFVVVVCFTWFFLWVSILLSFMESMVGL